MTEVVALFATRSDANSAIGALEEMGYDESSLGYVDRQQDGVADQEDRDFDGETDEETEATKGAVGGATGGAAVGIGAGLLASAGLAVVPGIGPFLAAGTLLGTLGAAMAGAAGGAAIGGAAGAIFGSDADDDDEHASYYREGVEQGGSLVTVSVRDEAAADVGSSLNQLGAKRVNVRGESGWHT